MMRYKHFLAFVLATNVHLTSTQLCLDQQFGPALKEPPWHFARTLGEEPVTSAQLHQSQELQQIYANISVTMAELHGVIAELKATLAEVKQLSSCPPVQHQSAHAATPHAIPKPAHDTSSDQSPVPQKHQSDIHSTDTFFEADFNPQPSATTSRPAGFVYANGTQLYLDQQPYYFQGTNIYWLGVASAGDVPDVTIDGIMNELSKAGIKVIRFWGFGFGWQHMRNLGPANWTLTDQAFDRLDWTIRCANYYGIRVIIPFVNFWNAVTGIQFWADNILGPGGDKEMFYADAKVFDTYVAYASNIINHLNPFTGRSLKDDPAILAWELMNEPHTSDAFEQGFNSTIQYGDAGIALGPGQVMGRLVNQWLCKAASAIKQLDPWHMVATGEEGHRCYGPLTQKMYWMNNGMKGADFEMNLKCSDVDFATLHLYPDNWNIPFNMVQWVLDTYVQDRANLSHAAGKPIVLEEYGCCSRADYKGKRSAYFQALHQAIDDAGFVGAVVWQALPWNGLGRDRNYDFSLSDDGGYEITAHAKVMNAMSGYVPNITNT